MKNTVSVAIAALAAAIAAKKAETDWKNTQPMPNKPAGIKVTIAATPSRASHDERHCVNALRNRSGWPRCSIELISPEAIRPSETAKATKPNQGSGGRRPASANAASNASNP